MNEDSHPDPDARLHFALWGAHDPATEEVQRHVRMDGCRACAAEVRSYQKMRHLLRTALTAGPSEAARAEMRRWLDAQLTDSPVEVDWLAATPVHTAVGVRAGASADRQLVCDTGEYHLDVLLHPRGPSRRFAVTGQVILPGDDPAAGVTVTLYLDRRPVAETITNRFGEFDFEAFDGSRFGVRIGEGATARHVEVWAAEDAA
jgi:anti-sigma factor RsiW